MSRIPFDCKFEFILPMENSVAAFAGKHTMKLVEIFHGLVDSLNKLAMTAVAKIINRLTRLGFERESVSFA